ncbi:MAG: phosphatidylglycerophosphatase A, partial [Verrucomicrobia bacterium]
MIPQPAWTRFLPEAFVLNMATLGRLGYFRAPGTWGSAAGVIWYTVMGVPAGPLWALVMTVAGIYLAFALCGEAEMRLHKVDPQEVILDEAACVPVVFIGMHDIIAAGGAWLVFLLGFALFRLFDIAKPFGISRIQRLTGGAGVVGDDLAAAVVSCGVLHALLRLTP